MRLTGWNLPLERLSATSLSTLVNCPEQFRRKYLLNEKEGNSGERFMGAVQHEALDYLFQQDADPDEAVSIAWQKELEERGEPDWHDLDSTEAFRRSKQMMKAYLPVAQREKPIAVEQRFEEQIDGVWVVGYIDREMSDRILEVKTSSRKESKPKSRWSFQGRLYSLASQKPVEWHVVTRQATPKVYTAAEEPLLYTEAFNPDATVLIVKRTIAMMSDLWTRYGKDNPWPMNGIHGDWTCGYCAYKKDCPAWS